MKTHHTRYEVERGPNRMPAYSMVRGMIAGAARFFDILGTGARPMEASTPEDDARNLRGDLERIGQDFSRVLSRLPKAHGK